MKESEFLHRISNHPVHVIDNGVISPSSLIPFCQFGDKMLGEKIAEFKVPVCNIFRPKILNKHLCYEADINKFKDMFSASSLKTGFTFFVDLNEDRQLSWEIEENTKNKEGL